MRPARAALLTTMFVAVAVAGCGGASHPRRDAVNRYFDRVDAAQAALRRESGTISQAFSRFSAAHNSPAEVHALRHARAEIETARDRVLAIRAPVDARPLHVDLVRMFILEADVAQELVEMTQFVPRYMKALTPLQAASAALSVDVHGAKAWKRIAAAFERYRASLASVLARLDKLSAPPTLRPGLNAERVALRSSVALCVSITAALAAHDAKATSAGIRELSGLGANNAAKTARQEQIAAARAYNARLRQISSLAAKIAKKREKLVTALG